jgi:exodeoxyribonuclease VII small subunit
VAALSPAATLQRGYAVVQRADGEELADVVRRLEAGGLTLEESLGLWERGEQLAEICQHWLDRARERLAAAAPSDSAEQPGHGAR